MSHIITFDTLKNVKKLKAAGVPANQAEAQVEVLREQTEAIQELIVDDNLAPKQDLKQLEGRLTNRINEINYKLTIRLGSLIVAGVVVLAALIKF